jgi:hypothetical protein
VDAITIMVGYVEDILYAASETRSKERSVRGKIRKEKDRYTIL